MKTNILQEFTGNFDIYIRLHAEKNNNELCLQCSLAATSIFLKPIRYIQKAKYRVEILEYNTNDQTYGNS